MKLLQTLLLSLVLSSSLAFIVPSTAEASWQAFQEGNNWYIREGNNFIPMADEKTARKTAKKINKAIEKGFVANDSGPCADPRSGVLC